MTVQRLPMQQEKKELSPLEDWFAAKGTIEHRCGVTVFSETDSPGVRK
jgi:hypothetical protein